MDWKARAKRMRQDVPMLACALRHPRTPWYAKAAALLAVAYALSPVDLIPDVIPVLGQLDDLLLVPLLIALAVRWIPPEVLADCRAVAAEKLLHKKWQYAIPVAVAWVLLLVLVLCIIF